MTRYLQVGENERLPLEILADSTTIFGRKRTGKSNNAAVLVEEGLRAGAQFIITDPKGDWWGLLSSADGSAAGFPLVVIGGKHATVQLNVGAGAATAAWVKRTGYSVILDLQGLEEPEVERFMSAFLKELRRLQEEDHKSIVLVVDEADELAPEDQRARVAVLRTMGLLIWFVKRGGFAGVGTICITQRPASISKNITTQSETIVVLHVSGSQDLDAVADALKHHVEGATKKERAAALDDLLREIVLLDKGQTIIVSAAQGLKGKIHRIQFRRRSTFDSGATPKMGELPKQPKVVAKVDLQQLSTEMQRAVAEIAENDPKALKATIKRLEAELAHKPAVQAATKLVEVPVLKDGQLDRAERLLAKIQHVIETTGIPLGLLKGLSEDIAKAIASVRSAPSPSSESRRVDRPSDHNADGGAAVRAAAPAANRNSPSTAGHPLASGQRPLTVRSGEPRRTVESNGHLPKTSLRMLSYAIAMEDAGIEITRKSLGAWSGVNPNGGYFDNTVRPLKEGGLLDGLRPTAHARAIVEPPTLDVETVRSYLKGKQRVVFDVLLAAEPNGHTRESLGEAIGVNPGGGYFDNIVRPLRQRGVITDTYPLRVAEPLR